MNKPNSFYKTDAWKMCRRAYKNKVFYCENCSAKGLMIEGDYVSHKRPLQKAEYYNSDISLNFDNLILLCKECYDKAHKRKDQKQSKKGIQI